MQVERRQGHIKDDEPHHPSDQQIQKDLPHPAGGHVEPFFGSIGFLFQVTLPLSAKSSCFVVGEQCQYTQFRNPKSTGFYEQA